MDETQNTQPAAAPVFDGLRKFTVPILSGGRKVCTVRFPKDTEWCERSRKQRSIRRFLGRGKSEAESIDSTSIDLEIFERIRSDEDGPEFDGAEAALVLAKLERASVESCEREGEMFRLTVRVPGAITEHLVRMPTRREMDKHEASSVKIVGARRSQEIRGFLEPSGELYDSIHESHLGYVGPVPIVHKVAVLAEIMAMIGLEEEEAIPEE